MEKELFIASTVATILLKIKVFVHLKQKHKSIVNIYYCKRKIIENQFLLVAFSYQTFPKI